MGLALRLAPLIVLGVSLYSQGTNVKWPPLPKKEFLSGRAATKVDVNSGRAAFVAMLDEKPIGKPLPIKIPQYAFHLDNGKKTPVIIIQAEQMGDKKYVGARLLDGKELVGFLDEFELLGTKQPSQ
jgi:hypothetical protein